MNNIILLIFVFVLAAFLGKELISKVPSQLHTPLMSATNAISGITVVGALVVCATSEVGSLTMILSFIAIVLATINIVGGYAVTDRMLAMFRKKGGKK
jgi:NAD(P) transhydrogenase subunit alpha